MTALVTLGMIDEEDLDQFVYIKETYALVEKRRSKWKEVSFSDRREETGAR